VNLLDESEAYRIEEGGMELADGEGRTTIAFEQEVEWRSDPAQLVGISWALRSTDGNGG